jgi:hypothetical protein
MMTDKKEKKEEKELESHSNHLFQNPLKSFPSLLFPLFLGPKELLISNGQ